MFDIWLLRSFVAVAESGGFTRAAKLLNSTQSTVSAQIQRLEEEAGRPLFVRNTRSVQLTAAGETLLGYARTILRLNEDARLRLSGVRHAGRVRVGVSEDLTGSWLPKVLQRLSRHYPKVEVELEIGVGSRLFKMVETEELDLAVGGVCHGPVAGRRLWSEPLVLGLFGRRRSPECAAARLLPALAYLTSARSAASRYGHGPQWRIISTASSLAGVQAAAMAGWAITPLPRQTLKPGLRMLDKKDKMPRLPQVEYVLQSRDVDTRSTISALGTLIQEMAPEATIGGAVKKRPLRSTGATAR